RRGKPHHCPPRRRRRPDCHSSPSPVGAGHRSWHGRRRGRRMGAVSQGDVMSLYHVLVQREGGWYVGRVLERAGITTQGKSLDDLVFMLRDAIELMWNERNPSLELVLSGDIALNAKGTRN